MRISDMPIPDLLNSLCRRAENGCLLWQLSTYKKGYGSIALSRPDGRKSTIAAHRHIWQQLNGPVPDGLFVCHTCDTPLCCEPTHLFLGTTQENTMDKVHKGRAQGKLCAADIRKIFALRDNDLTQQAIADVMGVSRSLIGLILSKTRKYKSPRYQEFTC